MKQVLIFLVNFTESGLTIKAAFALVPFKNYCVQW